MMKVCAGLAAAAIALLLGGCVVVDDSARSRVETNSRVVAENALAIGEQRSAGVGETLLRVRNYTETSETADFMIASEAFKLTGFDEDLDFQKDARFIILGERMVNGAKHTIALIPGWGVGMQIAPDGSVTKALINTDVEMIYQVVATPSTVRLRRAPYTRVTPKLDGQNYEIAYAGVDGQSMRFQYREYAAPAAATGDDRASRAAFREASAAALLTPSLTQDISFPIGTPQIQYRDIKIDIVSATPTAVTYIVRQGAATAGKSP